MKESVTGWFSCKVCNNDFEYKYIIQEQENAHNKITNHPTIKELSMCGACMDIDNTSNTFTYRTAKTDLPE